MPNKDESADLLNALLDELRNEVKTARILAVVDLIGKGPPYPEPLQQMINKVADKSELAHALSFSSMACVQDFRQRGRTFNETWAAVTVLLTASTAGEGPSDTLLEVAGWAITRLGWGTCPTCGECESSECTNPWHKAA